MTTEPQVIYVERAPRKRIWPWVLVAFLVLGAIGSMISDTPPPPGRYPSTALTGGTTTEYVNLVRQNGGRAVIGLSSSELITTGYIVCETLDRRVPMDEIISVTAATVDIQLGAAVITSAVLILCPEHQGTVNRWLDSQ